MTMDLSKPKRSSKAGLVLAHTLYMFKNRIPALVLCLLLPCASHAQTGDKLRLGYYPNVTHAQALYARATGELEKSTGASIEWVSFNAGPLAIEALFVDAVDATFIGPSPTINGYIKSKGE